MKALPLFSRLPALNPFGGSSNLKISLVHRWLFRGVLASSSIVLLVPALTGCEERATPENTPGPPGCGLRDPGQTAPGMLSWAQQKWLKRNGHPSSVRPNKHGGNDWLYQRNHGNQFGEEKSVEIFSFNAQGLLVGQDKEVEIFHGK